MTEATAGATAGSSVVRLPRAVRGSLIVFVLVGCAVLIPIGVVASVDDVPLVTVIAALTLAGVVVFVYRMVRVSLTLSGQALLVRNFVRTRRVARVDIEQVHVGAMTDSPFRGSIWVSLRDGSVLPIDVAGRRLPFGARGRSRVEERHRLLQGWLADQ